ncbi:MAG: sigma-70 family RNA polymerase sigma factor [Clostridia bacterium]|nr:sigma-70 family RNA polymerase sigma factor [Clostridia bacterium]
MVRINLKKYYPDYYTEDTYMDVEEKVAEFLEKERKKTASAKRKEQRYKAQYSLNAGDGIEEKTVIRLFREARKHEELRARLEWSMRTLTKVQRRRVLMRFDREMKYKEIAEAENVNVNAIEDSIKGALKKMRKNFC